MHIDLKLDLHESLRQASPESLLPLSLDVLQACAKLLLACSCRDMYFAMDPIILSDVSLRLLP